MVNSLRKMNISQQIQTDKILLIQHKEEGEIRSSYFNRHFRIMILNKGVQINGTIMKYEKTKKNTRFTLKPLWEKTTDIGEINPSMLILQNYPSKNIHTATHEGLGLSAYHPLCYHNKSLFFLNFLFSQKLHR